jgi:uncharacterized membrane protein
MKDVLAAHKKFGLESFVAILIAVHVVALVVWIFLLARGSRPRSKAAGKDQ